MMFMLLTINALVWLLSRYLTLLKVSSLKNTNTPPFTRSHPSFPSTFPACHGWKQGKHFTYKYKAHHLPQLGSIHTRFVKIVAFKEYTPRGRCCGYHSGFTLTLFPTTIFFLLPILRILPTSTPSPYILGTPRLTHSSL